MKRAGCKAVMCRAIKCDACTYCRTCGRTLAFCRTSGRGCCDVCIGHGNDE